jgi:hypothetical protein
MPRPLRLSCVQRTALINTRCGTSSPTLLCHLRRMSSPRAFAGNVSDDVLDRLYSIPASIGGHGLPGPTHESTLAVLKVLRDDFRRNHTFMNNLGYHKQVAISCSRQPSWMRLMDIYPQSHCSSCIGGICSRCLAGAHQRGLQRGAPSEAVARGSEPQRYH